jgi:hypothetical protein
MRAGDRLKVVGLGTMAANGVQWQNVGIENPMFQIIGDNDAGPEEEQLEALVDLRPEGGKGARATLRLPPRLVAYLQGLAHSNGRSLAYRHASSILWPQLQAEHLGTNDSYGPPSVQAFNDPPGRD